MSDDETLILSLPARLRRSGREIRMVIDGTDPFATAKPDARLIKLLVREEDYQRMRNHKWYMSGRMITGP